MRNSYLLGLGGALLATTSLSTAASAATLLAYPPTVASGPTFVTATANPFVAPKIAAQLFATSGLTSASILGSYSTTAMLVFSNQYGLAFSPTVTLTATGASFSSTALNSQNGTGITLFSIQGDATQTVVATMSGASAGCTVGVLGTTIQIYGCNTTGTAGGLNALAGNTSFLIGAIGLSNLLYTGATALSTAGATVTISGTVVQTSAASNTLETLAATTVLTSTNAAAITVSTAAASVSQGTGTTPFISVTQSLGNAGGGLTATLAAIYITGTGAVGQDLSAPIAVSQVVTGNLALTITSAALSDPAISNVRFVPANSATTSTNTTLTGTATFSALASTSLYGGVASGTNFVQVEYTSGTSITGGSAGTVAGTFTPATGYLATAAISGTSSAVTRSGFSTQVNSVQASTNTAVTSYVRITNGGAVAGTALITVYNAATGASLGSFTSASIPGYSTLQLSAAQIETSAGFSPVSGGSYDLLISGALPSGYVQHVTGNPGGIYVDFSGRRESSTGTN